MCCLAGDKKAWLWFPLYGVLKKLTALFDDRFSKEQHEDLKKFTHRERRPTINGHRTTIRYCHPSTITWAFEKVCLALVSPQPGLRVHAAHTYLQHKQDVSARRAIFFIGSGTPDGLAGAHGRTFAYAHAGKIAVSGKIFSM